MLYGWQPRYFGFFASDTVDAADIQAWLEKRKLIMSSVQQHLLRMQQCMKSRADKKRYERVFVVGDSVFLKLQPYIQMSLARRPC
jgi:hypothetical protein